MHLSKNLRLTLIVLLIAILLVAGYGYWRYLSYHPTTDDAYVQANIINIAAQVGGPVVKIYTQNHAFVKAGAPLFDIDPKPFQLTVAKAQAELENTRQEIKAAQDAVQAAQALVAQRQAQLEVTRKNTTRTLTVVARGLLPIASGDEAKSQLKVAEAAYAAANSQLQEAVQSLGDPGQMNAKIRAARAALAQAQLDLHHTRVAAPATGYLENFTLQVGATVTAQQPQFALIEADEWWVEANFSETQLARLQPGQAATIRLDMYPDKTFQGRVVSIGSGSGAAFSLLPPENATGNWVKVTQRFPVKIRLLNPDPRYPLRVGASSTVTVNTRLPTPKT